MASRRLSAENKRRHSPKKNNKHEKNQAESSKKEQKEVVVTVAPSSSTAPPVQPIVRRQVRRVLEPLPVDLRIQNQIKAAEIAYMATQFVMAVCFIFVPYTCYKSIIYLPPQEQGGMGGEPWEHYFELV
ncbi:hypothetical protein PFISCL1PPCAC_28146 [Pristionchus fissidentatus]|uniref:Uncharacterized protein n=1 Tax=Pristionchus fissidentatus TaxID=1538716 RepID=A0AAV5X467_9BILA|nr:hypothetical protein PFISCL1PPCAC_28146 [Pristionchus fissidentatus]